MTHDYKAALDDLTAMPAGTLAGEVCSWVCRNQSTIRYALTLAAEHERVKKERDELARALWWVYRDCPDEEWPLLDREIIELAKKVNENESK